MVTRNIPQFIANRCKSEQLKQAYIDGDQVYDIEYLENLFGFKVLMVTEFSRNAAAFVNAKNKEKYHTCMASMPFGNIYMAIELVDADRAHFYGLQLQYL